MVYFVGAGSGATDLITVRGANLLKQADVIVYAGSLVNPELLEYKKSDCLVLDSAYMNLEETHQALVDAEKAGKVAVRLHTGDPSLYGAIQEQMTLLDEEGIEYQVVPGVSSFASAASSLCAEFTVPDGSQTLILTRMAGRTPVPESEAIAKLAEHGSSMAIFLSTGMLEKLSAELIKGKYTAETPAAIVYKATWPDEQVFRCTIGTLAETAKANNITKTAQILIGDFLTAREGKSKLYDPTFTTEFRQGIGHED